MLLIAGLGRSGSTLLGALLDADGGRSHDRIAPSPP
jgi:hypothetical protein